MNAIELLTTDHEAVEALFQQVESTDPSEHPAIFEQINAELQAHAHIEETIFYPSLQEEGSDELVEITSEALQEHQQMKTFLGELSVAASDAEIFEPLLTKLIQDVRHHVEEEEGEMFPMVEDEFEEATIEAWGDQMQQEKDRFNSSTESAYA